MSDPRAEFRARLRHELRTPLHQIQGYAELLEEEARELGHEGYQADLRKIQAAARQALLVIDAAVPSDVTEPIGGRTTQPPPETECGTDAEATALPGATLGPGGRRARLLVVDDNAENRELLVRRLQTHGFLVESAEDGEVALEQLAGGGFDLVLLDIVMPRLGGLEVLARMRERWPASDLPVIMTTARDGADDVVAALGRGANDYVAKPLDLSIMLARIATQLTLRCQTQQIQRLAEDLRSSERFVRGLFGRYLSDEVVSDLLASPEGPRLGGEERRVTLLMSDLRGFTLLTEELPAEQVLQLLNSYLATMADVILSHHGTIDEFVGDAILAIFGAPLARPDDARRAVACAVEMQSAILRLNRKNEAEGLPPLDMGIAVHTGEVIVGNIGSERRTKYGVVGSAVNHAGRIESFTIGGQILISEATRAAAGGGLRVGARLVVDAKGTREPLVVYELRAVGAASVPDAPEEMVTLPETIDAVCYFVTGKTVQAGGFSARLLELSLRGATLLAYRRVRLLSNLKLDVALPDRDPVEIYAKVVHTSADGTIGVRFGAQPEETAAWIRDLLRDARAASR